MFSGNIDAEGLKKKELVVLVHNLQHENILLLRDLKEVRSDHTYSNNAMKSNEGKMISIQSRIDTLASDKRDLTINDIEKTNKIKDLETDVSDLSNKLADTVELVNFAEGERDDYSNALDDLQDQLGETENKLKDTIDKLNSSRIAHEITGEKLSEKNAIINKYKEEIECLVNERDDLRRQYDFYLDGYNNLQTSLAESKNTIGDLENDLMVKHNEMVSYREEYEKLIDQSDKMENLRDRVKDLFNVKNVLTSKVDELNRLNSAQLEEIKKLEEENNEINNNRVKLVNTIESQDDRIDALEEENAELEEQNYEAVIKVDKLEEENADFKYRTRLQIDEIEVLEDQLNKFRQNNVTANAFDLKIKELVSEKAALEKENEIIKISNTEKDLKIEELIRDVKNWRSVSDDYEDKYDEIRKQKEDIYKQLTQEISEINSRYINMVAEKEEVERLLILEKNKSRIVGVNEASERVDSNEPINHEPSNIKNLLDEMRNHNGVELFNSSSILEEVLERLYESEERLDKIESREAKSCVKEQVETDKIGGFR